MHQVLDDGVRTHEELFFIAAVNADQAGGYQRPDGGGAGLVIQQCHFAKHRSFGEYGNVLLLRPYSG